jgi:hypothetical protein
MVVVAAPSNERSVASNCNRQVISSGDSDELLTLRHAIESDHPPANDVGLCNGFGREAEQEEQRDKRSA